MEAHLLGFVPVRGGASGIVSLYTLTPAGAAWSEATIYSFGGGSDGGEPAGTPIFGSDGTLNGVSGASISLRCRSSIFS
jgi:hypothetical protein